MRASTHTQTAQHSDSTTDRAEADACFEATVEQSVLSDWLDQISSVVEEFKLHVRSGYLSTAAVDPANVAMISTTLAGDAFEHFDAADDVTVGVNLNALAETISMGGSDTLVHLDLDDDMNTLHVAVGQNFERELALIDPESIRAEPDLPALDFEATAEIPPKRLTAAVTGANMVSDHISIETNPDAGAIEFVADGDTDETRYTVDPDGLTAGGDVQSSEVLLSLDYFDEITGVIPSDAEPTLKLATEKPIKLDYDFGPDGDLGHTTQMVAPRIDSN